MKHDSPREENRIEIPLSARAVKDWFKTEEQAKAVVPEIQKFLQEGNDPFMWTGHTHTRPPKGHASSAAPNGVCDFYPLSLRIERRRDFSENLSMRSTCLANHRLNPTGL